MGKGEGMQKMEENGESSTDQDEKRRNSIQSGRKRGGDGKRMGKNPIFYSPNIPISLEVKDLPQISLC